MIDITAITDAVRTDSRRQAAGHMLDAVECVTDDHVRRRAADPWHQLLAGDLGADEVRARAEAALKSLTAAIADLDSVDGVAGQRIGEQAMDVLVARGINQVEVFYLVGRGWQWTCDLCDGTRILVGPLEDRTGRPNLVDLAAAHVRDCPAVAVDA